MQTTHPPSTRPSASSRHLRRIAGVALVVATCFAVTAAAWPRDAEGSRSGPAFGSDAAVATVMVDRILAAAPPVDDLDPMGFELAIDNATGDAAAAARWAEAARYAADLEAARAASRYQGGPSEAGLAALRACESSGNYGSVSSTGTYRGAYQFSQQTWNSVASRHHPWLVGVDPAAAAPADQDAQARALYDMSGRGQWPHCGRHLP